MELNSFWGQFIYQSIGILALIFTIFSFQFKDFKNILMMQFIASILWAIHYLIGQAYSGFLMNLIAICRSLGFELFKGKKKRFAFTIFISLCFIGMGVTSCLCFQEKIYIAIITGIASCIGNIFFYIGDPKKYKIAQLFAISPCWLFNNIIYLSIGGILCESFNMISVIAYFVRIHLTNKTKDNSINN